MIMAIIKYKNRAAIAAININRSTHYIYDIIAHE